MKKIAALRTRSRSSFKCWRNGIRPASSSAASGSASSAMLLLGRVGGVGLGDRTGRGLDHRGELGRSRLLSTGLELAGGGRERQLWLSVVGRCQLLLRLGADRQFVAAQRALQVADRAAGVLVVLD